MGVTPRGGRGAARLELRALRWLASLAALLWVAVQCRVARADPLLEVRVTPSSLQLAVNTGARVEIRGPDVPLEQLDVAASTGTVRGLTRVGPGQFVAQFQAPASRAPDVALIVARVRDSATVGVASVPLLGRYHLTVTVEPGARVEVQVGPLPERHATVPPSGVVDMMLHVPPGVSQARITATDRFGNATASVESIGSPPSHRVVLLTAPPPSGSPGALRWFVIAATPAGALASLSSAPAIEVPDALPELTLVAPGIIQVVVRPRRQPEARTVTLSARQPGAVVTPASLSAVVPAAVPSRAELGSVTALAGADIAVPLAVRDEEGAPIVRLEAAIAAQLEGASLLSVEARSDGYVLLGRAPEHVGTAVIVARVVYPGMAPVEARGVLRVVAAHAARVEARAPPLVVGAPARIELRAVDRFGNPAPIEHPAVTAEGASIERIEPVSDALGVRLDPSATVIMLSVRGDYDLRDRIELRAAPRPPERPVALALVGVARTNLGALWMWGARLRLDVRVPVARDALVLELDAGLEAGGLRDAQGGVSADVQAAPVFFRLGYLARLGSVELGPVIGVGGRGVLSVARADTGEMSQSAAVVPGLQAAILLRARLGFSVIFAEVGEETGSLDGPVRGTLGGAYGAIGWGVGL